MLTNIMDLLAEAQEEVIAIAAPGRSPITYCDFTHNFAVTGSISLPPRKLKTPFSCQVIALIFEALEP